MAVDIWVGDKLTDGCVFIHYEKYSYVLHDFDDVNERTVCEASNVEL
jgi:hypothetical protein